MDMVLVDALFKRQIICFRSNRQYKKSQKYLDVVSRIESTFLDTVY